MTGQSCHTTTRATLHTHPLPLYQSTMPIVPVAACDSIGTTWQHGPAMAIGLGGPLVVGACSCHAGCQGLVWVGGGGGARASAGVGLLVTCPRWSMQDDLGNGEQEWGMGMGDGYEEWV